MGVVLFGLSVGSMSGILCSAWLVKRFGTRKVIRTTMSFAVLGMLVLSGAMGHFRPAVRLRSGYLRRQLWLCRGRY